MAGSRSDDYVCLVDIYQADLAEPLIWASCAYGTSIF